VTLLQYVGLVHRQCVKVCVLLQLCSSSCFHQVCHWGVQKSARQDRRLWARALLNLWKGDKTGEILMNDTVILAPLLAQQHLLGIHEHW